VDPKPGMTITRKEATRLLGQALERAGTTSDAGVRALNALLPEGARAPQITEKRPGSE